MDIGGHQTPALAIHNTPGLLIDNSTASCGTSGLLAVFHNHWRRITVLKIDRFVMTAAGLLRAYDCS